MSAKVATKFDKRFELNEENIRRIHADIRKRTPQQTRNDIVFEVFREDSLVFRTTEVDRLLSENNDSTQKIKELKIEYKDDSLNILLEFDAKNGAELTIDGEDRDQVFLIASDLREYMQKEVCCITGGMYDKKLIILPLVIIAAFMIYFLQSFSPNPNDAELQQILASTDVQAKLNHLIQSAARKTDLDHKGQAIGLMPFLFMIAVFVPWQKIFNFFFPGNIFLIGKQISVIANRRGFVRNIFWCVIVALIIALVTGYYFLWLSK